MKSPVYVRCLTALLGLLLLTGFCWATPGLETSTKLEVTENPLPFGKPATLIVTLAWDSDWAFEPPPAEDLKLDGLTILDHFTTTPAGLPSGRKSIEYHLVFTRFEPGPATIGPVVFETPGGSVKTRPLDLEFKGAQAKDGDQPDKLRGPKEVMKLSTRDFWKTFGLYLGAGLGLLGLILFIVRKTGILDRLLSPRRRALRRLSRLSKAFAENKRSEEQAVMEMVDLVRIYLHKTYGLVTREATSKEISQQVVLDNRCQNLRPAVKNLLERGDACKFARRIPERGEIEDLSKQIQTALEAEARRPK